MASHCIEKWPTSSMRAAYTVGILVFQLLIPILVLAVVHVAIANHLNAHRLSTNTGSKEGAGGGGGSTGRNGSLKGSTLKKISKSSIFRIRSKKKHQHMILDESHAVGVPGKRAILNGNDNALYNISSDDACKFLQPPSTTMAIETGVGVGSKQNSARVTDYEQQTSNGFPLNGSNANATTAATTTEGNPMEIASPIATSTVLEPDSLAISLRTGNSITTGERGKNDRRDLEGRHSFGETNTNLPNPFQVKFKSNIGVCITFREFCQLSDGKTNNNGHKKRIELANHNNVSSSSSPSKIQESCCAAVEVERKLSHNGCQSLEASPDKTCARTSPTIGNEKHDSAFLVGPITDEVKLNGGAAQPNGNSTTIVMPVAPTAFAPSPSGNKNGSASSKRTKKELARNKRTTIILLLVSVIFTVSWLPWHLLTLWADLYPNFTSTSNLYMLYAVSHIIAMSSAVTNAVLYGWLNTNLRRELTQVSQGYQVVLFHSKFERGSILSETFSFKYNLLSSSVDAAAAADVPHFKLHSTSRYSPAFHFTCTTYVNSNAYVTIDPGWK